MSNARGFTLLEVLISMVVIAFGLIGIAALQGHAVRAEMESYQRAQALVLLGDMVNRIESNRDALQCYADDGVALQVGKGFDGKIDCTSYGLPSSQKIANDDVLRWHEKLIGSTEVGGGGNSGAMIDAYGCLTFDGDNEITVRVYWQGLAPTVDAELPDLCSGAPAYGEGMRRGVSESIQGIVVQTTLSESGT